MHVKRIIIDNDKQSAKLAKLNERVPAGFPKLNFNLLCLGARNSGKTNSIIWLLLEVYKDLFDDIFIFSPTVFTDKKFKALKLDEEKLFDKYTDNDLKSILEFQQLEANEDNHILIIMDDIVGEFNNKTSFINKLITRTRHNNISIIIGCQYSKFLSPTIRNNLTSVMVFNNVRLEEIKKLRDILDPNFDVYFDKLRGTAKHNFIYMNFEDDIIMYNFNNKVITKDGNFIDVII